eukprot:g2735.t1
MSVLGDLCRDRFRCHPLMPELLGGQGTSVTLPLASFGDAAFSVDDVASEIKRDFGLNEEQSSVIRIVASWFRSDGDGSRSTSCSSRFALTHGIFGSGKSHLLVAVVHMLHRIGVARKSPVRVLCAAATNVAVDRVLLGILERGEIANFQRVGSAKKVAKPILRHMAGLSVKDASSGESILKDESMRLIRDLKVMKSKCRRKRDREHIEAALKRAARPPENHSFEPIVGVTCASSGSALLEGRSFDVVVLDECSQMTEPCSLMPLLRFRCEHALLVGDPKQLPPVCNSRALSSTLFSRLQRVGRCPTVMLRRQYRCHPTIATLASELFYEGRVLNGIEETSRPPLFHCLGPVVSVDVPRGVAHGQGSMSNAEEVREVCAWVRLAMTVLVNDDRSSPITIGVITMYHAQVRAIRRALETSVGVAAATDVQVSTVDAFQGAERDIIIISTVATESRSGSSNAIAFISQNERVCVAMTRARHHLIVVGSDKTLRKSRVWGLLARTAARTGDAFVGGGAGVRARHKASGRGLEGGVHSN